MKAELFYSTRKLCKRDWVAQMRKSVIRIEVVLLRNEQVRDISENELKRYINCRFSLLLLSRKMKKEKKTQNLAAIC